MFNFGTKTFHPFVFCVQTTLTSTILFKDLRRIMLSWPASCQHEQLCQQCFLAMITDRFRFDYEYDYDYEIHHFWRQLLASSRADVIKS